MESLNLLNEVVSILHATNKYTVLANSCWQTQIVCVNDATVLANCRRQIELVSIFANFFQVSCCCVIHTHTHTHTHTPTHTHTHTHTHSNFWPTRVGRVNDTVSILCKTNKCCPTADVCERHNNKLGKSWRQKRRVLFFFCTTVCQHVVASFTHT